MRDREDYRDYRGPKDRKRTASGSPTLIEIYKVTNRVGGGKGRLTTHNRAQALKRESDRVVNDPDLSKKDP